MLETAIDIATVFEACRSSVKCIAARLPAQEALEKEDSYRPAPMEIDFV